MKASVTRWTRNLLPAVAGLAVGLAAPAALAGKVDFGERGHAQNPMWSVDGKHLAFEVNTFGGDGIDMYFADVNGDVAGKVQKVKLPGSSGPYSGQQVVMNATWHPQGLAVFEGSNSGGKFRLYFAQPGGAMAAEMLDNSKAPGNLQFPVVAPNGNLLGYISDQTGDGDVMSWDRSSNTISQVTKTNGVSETFPYFAADGNTLLYMEKGDAASIHEADLSAGTTREVASGRGDQSRPIYAGDKVVYFTSERGEGNWDLAVVNRDGSGKKVLAKGVKLPERARPAVTPDGRYVAFVYSDPTKHDSVRIVDLQTGKEIEIPTSYTSCADPAITQQGGRVKLAYTALPSNDSDWRFLYVADVTDRL
jgi:Tol biopolymer transport system component